MSKRWDPKSIQAKIEEALPEGKVIPRHNQFGHFYEVRENHQIGEPLADSLGNPNILGPVYPSVTGKLQILKDEGISDYKMNRALDYIFGNFSKLTEENLMEHIDAASKVSGGILMDAGDIGTRCHDYREQIFQKWIDTGERPQDFLSFIPPEDVDVRAQSATRALDKFCTKEGYVPVACELLMYSHKLKTAGTLDDIGLMKKVIREGNAECSHASAMTSSKGVVRCLECDYKAEMVFVLMDLKTSNQFKNHYFFQVALYYWMFVQLTGLKPQRCFILKVSKEDGTYKIEDLKKPAKIAQYALHLLKTDEGVEFIKGLRKDNQRSVAPAMKL